MTAAVLLERLRCRLGLLMDTTIGFMFLAPLALLSLPFRLLVYVLMEQSNHKRLVAELKSREMEPVDLYLAFLKSESSPAEKVVVYSDDIEEVAYN